MTGNITQAKLDYLCPKAISMRVMLIFVSQTGGSVTTHVFASLTPPGSYLTCPSKKLRPSIYMNQEVRGCGMVNCELMSTHWRTIKLGGNYKRLMYLYPIFLSKDNFPSRRNSSGSSFCQNEIWPAWLHTSYMVMSLFSVLWSMSYITACTVFKWQYCGRGSGNKCCYFVFPRRFTAT